MDRIVELAQMDGVMLTIRDSSQSVQTAASEIALGGQDLSRRTDNAASSLQQSSASIEERCACPSSV